MELAHLALTQLSVSAANMRSGKKLPDIADLIPSVRARGVLTPLLVRPGAVADQFEIVAGRRRYHAALALADEGGEAPLLPCAIMAEHDDAAALEASIIENCAREDPGEVTQWTSYTRLIKEGRNVAQIAATFGMEDAKVKRILALGNLHPRIRDLYAKGDVDALSVRHLTLASRAKQTEWLGLYRDPDARAPTGQALKNWLFGGQSIPTKVALFDRASYPDPIVTDLFGDEQWFSNADSFWTLQGEAIARLRADYLDKGWTDAVVMEAGHYFQRWEHEKVAKTKGGKVFISVTRAGEVEAHEGWLSTREVRKRERGEQVSQGQAPLRPELTSTLKAYLDLHRHAMVQAALVQRPGVALRLMVAHAVAGSWLWNVKPDPLRAPTPAIAESHEHCAARAEFAKARMAARGLLGLEPEAGTNMDTLAGGNGMDTGEVFRRLLALCDEEIMAILSVVMAETLAVGSGVLEMVGIELAVDPLASWQADETFLTLLRQREALQALIGDIAGEAVAASNAHEKVKTLRGILGDCLAGTNGRAKAEPWAPRWLHFPARTYFAPADAADGCDGGDADAGDDIDDDTDDAPEFAAEDEELVSPS
jgi:ParB family chromosome partitioning protein